MDDPTRRRSPGTWPRDRPVRWSGLAGNLTWFLVATAALVVQGLLAIPLVVVTGPAAGEALGGFGRIGLALVWGGLTLFAAWSWVLGRWRVVIAPIATGALLWLATRAG
jgi:hypothetical protein